MSSDVDFTFFAPLIVLCIPLALIVLETIFLVQIGPFEQEFKQVSYRPLSK